MFANQNNYKIMRVQISWHVLVTVSTVLTPSTFYTPYLILLDENVF